MGMEAVCTVRLNDQASEGRAHCGDNEIDFRGEFKFKWFWPELTSASESDGVLKVTRKDDTAEFHLGSAAPKWLHAIQNPKSRLDKLGLKAGHHYAIWGAVDEAFGVETEARAGAPASDPPYDIVFVRFDSTADLPRLKQAREAIKPDGMVWAIWPKGRKDFREDDARRHGSEIGLVDVKVASLSNELSGLKLVIPVAMRK
jgi:hypothetical protein